MGRRGGDGGSLLVLGLLLSHFLRRYSENKVMDKSRNG